MNYQEVDVTRIITGKNPRMDENHIGELRESIKNNGLMYPLLVREIGESLEVIDGHRRLKAIQELGLEIVPVVFIADESPEAMKLMVNILRRDLNIMDVAAGVLALSNDRMTIKDISRALSMTKKKVEDLMSLNFAIPEIQADLRAGLLPVETGVFISKETEVVQKAIIEYCRRGIIFGDAEKEQAEISQWDSLDEIKSYVLRQLRIDISNAIWLDADENLNGEAPPCSVCPKRTGVNKDLFGEGDSCTDGKCFESKLGVFIWKIKTDNDVQYALSESYMPTDLVLSSHQYSTKVKNFPDELHKLGVMVDGKKKGKVINFVLESDARSTGQHTQSTPEEKEKVKADRVQKKQEREDYKTRLQAIAKADIDWKDAIRLIVENLWKTWNGNTCRLVLEAMGIEQKDAVNDSLGEVINRAPADQLVKIAMIGRASFSYGYGVESLEVVEKALHLTKPKAEKKKTEKKSKKKPVKATGKLKTKRR